MKVGQPLAFESPNELLDLFFDYVDDCINNNECPNMAGFRGNKGIARTTLYKYEQKEEYGNAFTQIYDILEDKTFNNKSIDPSTKKLALQSKFGYVDVLKTDNTNLNADVSDDADLIEKLTAKYLK